MERGFLWLRLCHLFRFENRTFDSATVFNGFFVHFRLAFGQMARGGKSGHPVIIDGDLRAFWDVGG